MTVKVYPYREKLAHGNILWPGKFEARGGRFPPNHPCAAGAEMFGRRGTGEGGEGQELDAFRARGYWASCFPEGDGITWKPKRGQSDEQCITDIRECFGWDARWAPGVKIDSTPSPATRREEREGSC